MRADHDGIGIEFDVHGHEGAPAVVLLHGFPDSARLWRHQVPRLVDAGLRVVTPDLRGFGRSDRPADVAGSSLLAAAGDVTAVLDVLGLDRAHVVGHDFGAALAWVVATFAPERVDHLVAMSVGHPGAFDLMDPDQARSSWYMLLFQHQGIAEHWLTADDWSNFRSWSGHPDADAVVDEVGSPEALTPMLNWYRANVPVTSWVADPPQLPPVEAPTMGVWSSDDFALGEAQMLRSAEHVAGPWRYERVEGAGHWMQLDAPDRVTELLVDFLNGAPRSSN